MMDDRTRLAIELMERFAERTGIAAQRPPRRYLWTDAFAVCNFLGLARETGEARFAELALRLVDRVHHGLGRHRDDDARRGWISGLPDAEGEAHPTAGGLRIGKPLPERAAGEPFDERLEWERDGQYFHYLTKWMHALDQVARHTGRARHAGWARELGVAAHRGFAYTPHRGGSRRMYWKMSIDLSRPLVASMGQHDPLDGLVTYVQVEATTPGAAPSLADAAADFAAMLVPAGLATSDPLGVGGLLGDALRLQQLVAARAVAGLEELVAALLEAAALGLRAFASQGELRRPAGSRLAFRELGLAIGLAAADTLAADAAHLPPRARAALEAVLRHAPLRDAIESLWQRPESRETAAWREHADIDDVMLATSLRPEGFLVLPPSSHIGP